MIDLNAITASFEALFPGKKTYIAAAGFLILAAYQGYTGNVPAAVQSVLQALAAAGLRAAVAKVAAAP